VVGWALICLIVSLVQLQNSVVTEKSAIVLVAGRGVSESRGGSLLPAGDYAPSKRGVLIKSLALVSKYDLSNKGLLFGANKIG